MCLVIFRGSAESLVREMGDRLRHRGPDDSGESLDPRLGTALTFRRLAILDRSDQGHQPMVSANGRFTLAVNGEVYNYRALRDELEQQGHSFRGQTDTEVLLAGIRRGVWRRRSSGALACSPSRWWMSRPGNCGWPATASARSRSTTAGSGAPLPFRIRSRRRFRRSGFHASRGPRRAHTLPAPRLCSISLLHPGRFQEAASRLPADSSLGWGARAPGSETIRRYWSVPEPEEEASFKGSAEEYVSGLEQLLRETIRMQMLADVPVGAFLSGGIRLFDCCLTDAGPGYCSGEDLQHWLPGCPSRRVRPCRAGCGAPWNRSHDLALRGFRGVKFGATGSRRVLRALCGLIHNCLSWRWQSWRAGVSPFLSPATGETSYSMGMAGYVRALWRWQQLRQHPGIGFGFGCGINTLSALAAILPVSGLAKIDQQTRERSKSMAGRTLARLLPPPQLRGQVAEPVLEQARSAAGLL